MINRFKKKKKKKIKNNIIKKMNLKLDENHYKKNREFNRGNCMASK